MKHTQESDRRSRQGSAYDSNGRDRPAVRDRGVDEDNADRTADPPDRQARASNDHGRQRPGRISGAAVVAQAREQLAELTGQPCESVSALNRTRQGWRVVLEVLELQRIPRTTDILASYAVELDENGDLLGYERTHRYYRNDVGGDQ